MSLSTKLLVGLAVIVALVGGAAAVLTMAFPGDIVRDRIVAEVKARTGRDLLIKGPVTFASVPSARVTLQNVVLSAPAGMTAPPLATMASLEVKVAWLPLLWREVVVESIVLDRPVFALTVDADDRKSWTIERRAAGLEPAIRLAQATSTANDASPQTKPARQLPEISLPDIRVVNGTVRYENARLQLARELTALETQVAIQSLQHPAEANGSFDFRGERVDFKLNVGAVAPILSNAPARIAMRISARPMTAGYEGTVLFGGNEAEGALTAKAPSTALAAAWLGADVPRSLNLGSMELTGQLRRDDKVYAISQATLDTNGMHATGQLAIDATPERPTLRGTLETAELDLNAMIAPPAANTSEDTAAPRSLAPSDTGEAPAPTGPRVQGYTARGGWSEDPIRLTALRAIDADVMITVGRLLYKDIKVDRSRLGVSLTDSVMTANLEELSLYGGRGKAIVTLDARTPELTNIGLNVDLDGVAVGSLLQDSAKLNWIEGQGKLKLAVSGAGDNQLALIRSLAGKAELSVPRGAIVGVDIDRMADELADGNFRNLKTEPGDKTAFTNLASTWQIKDGIAANNDLRLASKLLRVSGNGTVSLPERALDYMIKPRLAGEGEANKGKGIEVPVRIAGSWEKPKFKADVAGAVNDLGERLKGKNTDEIVDELVGKDSETRKKAKKLLDKLFR